MIDNEAQIEMLEAFQHRDRRHSPDQWDVFVKIDVGSSRAGVKVGQPRLSELVRRAEASKAVRIYGFYCHAGHSYSGRTPEEAKDVLHVEVDSVLAAANLMSSREPLTLSIGATPTAHVIDSLKAKVPPHMRVELHAGECFQARSSALLTLSPGNFPANDLQQVATGLVTLDQQAVRVLAEVCSVYPERNEALINAGAIALSRESSSFQGFGMVTSRPGWTIVRLSQEHGIVGETYASKSVGASNGRVEQNFAVGDKVFLYCQHTCITAAAFPVYWIVNDNDVVTDFWKPWKFW